MISKATTYGIHRQKKQVLSGPIFSFNVLYQGKSKYKSKAKQATCNHQRSDLRLAFGKDQQPSSIPSYAARQHRYRNLGLCLPILLLATGLFLYGASGNMLAESASRNYCASTDTDSHLYDHMEPRRDHIKPHGIPWSNDYAYDHSKSRRDQMNHLVLWIPWNSDYAYDHL